MASTSLLLELLNGELNWLDLSQPLFYRHEFALRFGLEVGEDVSPQTARQVKQSCHRSCEIYNALIDPRDAMLLVAEVILPGGEQPGEAHQFRLWQEYVQESALQRRFDRVQADEPRLQDEDCHRFLFGVLCRAAEVRHGELIRAIVVKDLRFSRHEPSVSEPCYLIDLDKNACFHVYDDRGLDVVAKDPAVLLPLYRRYCDWLLDYDVERMHSIFSQI